MGEQNSTIERRSLIWSSASNLLIGAVGLTVFSISSSQAILLDGLFNLAYFATALMSLKVAKLVQQGDDKYFPFGYFSFEPLVNGLKGVLVLGVTITALIGALDALLTGGNAIAAGIAVGYGVFATLTCSLAALLVRRAAERTGSPLLHVDAENWFINAAISSVVVLAFAGTLLLEGSDLEFLVPFVDPSVVLLAVMLSVSVPIRISWRSVMALLGAAASPTIVRQVTERIQAGTVQLPVQDLVVRAVQPGRTLTVLVHVILPRDFGTPKLSALDEVRRDTLAQLQKRHPAIVLEMVFTTQADWGLLSNAGAET